jgi:hypothetical protein
MEDVVREPVELIDEDLDEVAGGLVLVKVARVNVIKSIINGGGNDDTLGGVEIGNVE